MTDAELYIYPGKHPDPVVYAMAKLLERLVAEGYVRPDRTSELLERAQNLERNRGFLTHAELKQRRKTPADDIIEDLFS